MAAATIWLIGRQHFHFGAFVADQRIDVPRGMGRAGERVGFGKIVAFGSFRARRVHALNRKGGAWQSPRPEAPRSGLEGRSSIAADGRPPRSRLQDTALSRGSSASSVGSSALLRSPHARFAFSAAHGIEPALDRRPDGGGDIVLASVGIDHDAATGLGGGNIEERPPQGLMKRQPLRFEPVRQAPSSSRGSPLKADSRVEVEDQGQVGLVRANRQAFERGDEVDGRDCPPLPDRPWSNWRIGSETETQAPLASAGRSSCRRTGLNTGGGEQERLPGGIKIGGKARENRLAQGLWPASTSPLGASEPRQARAP